METAQRITEVLQEAKGISNWEEPYFDWKKAYVASVLAQLAYLHIPEYELKNADRANLIPCEEYRRILVGGLSSVSFEQIFRSSDIAEYFTVENPYVVVVVVIIGDVFFISLRGTQSLYDWLVNLNVSKSDYYDNFDSVKPGIYFHKGFYRATASCMGEIHSEIERRRKKPPLEEKNITIYVTGHSLGGALAAILHALWRDRGTWFYLLGDGKVQCTKSCYTFGMPRYGGFRTMEYFVNPFHIYNETDIVPAVPPKFLGFEDSFSEYCLTSKGTVDRANIKSGSFIQFIYRLLTLKGIRAHDIERYINLTKSIRDGG